MQLYFQSMALSSQDKMGLAVVPASTEEELPRATTVRGVCTLIPQLCTGQCSFKADRVPRRGEEGDKWGNEGFLQHLLIPTAHSTQP